MRDSVLRLCLRAYPPVSRERDGRAILDLARDLSEKSRVAFLREAGGLLCGGVRERGKLLRLDITGAPWRTALERLVLPLSVAMLCFLVAFAFPSRLEWIGWWSFLALLGAAVAVFGAASRRRLYAAAGSSLVLVLLVFDAFRELNTHYARWTGDVIVGEVNILAMWLPVALLLLLCAVTVGRSTIASRRSFTWIICAPVAVSVLLAILVRSRWQGMHGSLLGAVFMYTPLVLVVVTAVYGAMRGNTTTKTAAALLVAASCVPILWLLAMVVPAPPVPGEYVPFAYYLPGIAVACFIVMCLLRNRVQDPVPSGHRG
ncbi:MAG: hypothetical protein JW990_08410 [Thermoleophilia bacterium]|nr:hypothetical protein [Thermoleophilia bacterium]